MIPRMSTPEEWRTRANEEAVAILAQTGADMSLDDYANIRSYMAVAWLQGVNYGSHLTLSQAERAFRQLQEDLT